MKIYFAGVPAGLQRDREEKLPVSGITNRMIAFYYTQKALVTLRHYLDVDSIDYTDVRDFSERLKNGTSGVLQD